jgi:hypothetical protein
VTACLCGIPVVRRGCCSRSRKSGSCRNSPLCWAPEARICVVIKLHDG